MDLVVTVDVAALKGRLFELMPDEQIEVRAVGDAVILSGRVSSSVRLTRALEVAERYAPEKVTNLMAVTGSQPVMLAVRFAEVQRRLVKELGLNTKVSNSACVISAGDALLNGVLSDAAFATGRDSCGISSVTPDIRFH